MRQALWATGFRRITLVDPPGGTTVVPSAAEPLPTPFSAQLWTTCPHEEEVGPASGEAKQGLLGEGGERAEEEGSFDKEGAERSSQARDDQLRAQPYRREEPHQVGPREIPCAGHGVGRGPGSTPRAGASVAQFDEKLAALEGDGEPMGDVHGERALADVRAAGSVHDRRSDIGSPAPPSSLTSSATRSTWPVKSDRPAGSWHCGRHCAGWVTTPPGGALFRRPHRVGGEGVRRFPAGLWWRPEGKSRFDGPLQRSAARRVVLVRPRRVRRRATRHPRASRDDHRRARRASDRELGDDPGAQSHVVGDAEPDV